MFWLLCLLTLPSFERQGNGTIFFPYGSAWAGYEYTADLRAQLRPLLITYFGFAVLLAVAYKTLNTEIGQEAAYHAVCPEIVLLLCFYVPGVFAVTRAFPKVVLELDGNAAGLKSARIFPVWGWRTLVVVSSVMAVAGLFGAANTTASGGDWLAGSDSLAFFALCLPVLIGQLRLRRRMQRQPA